jgi:Zn-dependent M28 family amino/carboxypeptidase
MTKHSAPLAVCALAVAACAGDTSDATAQAATIDVERMLADVEFLAADSLEGRLAGSVGNREAREFVAARFARLGIAAFGDSYVQEFTTTRRGVELHGANVVAYVEGTEVPDQFIVITAHYDHVGVRDGEVFNGADDNASGTAALMALAAHFVAHRPRHSIIFAAVDAEERGMGGSRSLVEEPPVELGQMAVNVNMDMVSHSERELYVAGTHHYPFLKPIVERVAVPSEMALLFGHDSPDLGNDDWTNSSDHAPFHRSGIPFLYFGVEDHEDYHRASDEFDKINAEFFASAVTTILRVVLELDGDLESVIAARQ